MDRLKAAVMDLETGVKSPANYTVGEAIEDWLAKGLRGSTATRSPTTGALAGKHVIPLIGKVKLKDLCADDVDEWLDGLAGSLSSRTATSSSLRTACAAASAYQ
ncbi:hypothetical protein BJF79_28575 [Actinomadura sp. CNU-125]|uniref:hypothetical protein n=1 Tax=Actinomadura sp. CNU-125 TaxID=1904961 RepID=UPI0009685C43|nr:hypothetical protein [Actinomadura sp. CNU-125]OLT37898.1 hypothetical protein BJF79_28575 [Actinomadura sp. CNU-125]